VIVYPAIDIRGGRCVRLVEGDFNRETAFDADPADAAMRWAAAGAEWIHVVDLDAAVAGEPVNLPAIERIVASVDVPVQLGGGMRTREHVASTLGLGVTRVVIGTKAIDSPEFVTELVSQWGDRIAVGLDARDGKLAAAGWLDQTDVRATDVASSVAAAGISSIVYTDIRRDGTLAGPNLEALAEMIAIAGNAVIASGGVGSIEDVERVRDLGAGGVIIGRALYDGRVDLAEAIRRSANGVTVS
jgi:phosphoribosylformimino-5-aminoimidazole carboxamide ribotide isomerase